MDTATIAKVALALLPFLSLFGGFLVFHWGSSKTTPRLPSKAFSLPGKVPVASTEAIAWPAVKLSRPMMLASFVERLMGSDNAHYRKRSGMAPLQTHCNAELSCIRLYSRLDPDQRDDLASAG